MASDYGLNFGFRRSDESLAIREGRFRTPKTGGPLLQGCLVTIDADELGFLKKAGANPAPTTGLFGVLVQEDSHIGTVFEASPYLGHDSIDLGTTKRDTVSVMWSGPGSKIWLKNTPAYDRGDRHKDAVTLIDVAGVTPGKSLAWDGNKFVLSTSPATALLTVTHVSAGYAEAVFTF